MSNDLNYVDVIDLTTDIVSAYVSNHAVNADDLPALIKSVHHTMVDLNNNQPEEKIEDLKPAVPVKKSITSDYIICLEDGKPFKSLKRHLRTHYDLSPEEYREKWGLPADYPMVAPNYAQKRSSLAREMGLGQQRKQSRKKAS